MESAAVPVEGGGVAPGEKGLKSGALGYLSNLVIGVASTAPGYSLAATLGFVTAVAGDGLPRAGDHDRFVHSHAVDRRCGYSYMNKADPDCGTSFTWVTRRWARVSDGSPAGRSSPRTSSSWRPSPRSRASTPSCSSGSTRLADSTFWVTFVGVVWIVIMTAIVTIGIELSARTQVGSCSAAEIFIAGGLRGRRADQGLLRAAHRHYRCIPRFSWINPFEISTSALYRRHAARACSSTGAGTDGDASTRKPRTQQRPRARRGDEHAILLGIYVIVAVAAHGLARTGELSHNKDDVLSALGGKVFGSPLDKILIIAVLTSAAASTQTTILPTARTTLSMARCEGDARGVRASSSALPDPRCLDDPRWAWRRSSGTSADICSARTSSSTRWRRSA